MVEARGCFEFCCCGTKENGGLPLAPGLPLHAAAGLDDVLLGSPSPEKGSSPPAAVQHVDPLPAGLGKRGQLLRQGEGLLVLMLLLLPLLLVLMTREGSGSGPHSAQSRPVMASWAILQQGRP